jgi:phosphoglycolate phosphatase
VNSEIIKNILFDLDGTLIDSYPGIQKAFDFAYKKIYNDKCTYDIRPFVGPPIKDIFAKISGETDQEKTLLFVQNFQKFYDTEFYKLSVLYNGVNELFEVLNEKKINLYIATNKRFIPTKLILEILNISRYFKKIYCIDNGSIFFADKTEMVAQIISEEGLEISETLFVGDTNHDFIAARNNNLNFIYANYGFGNLMFMKNIINNPFETTNYL